MPDAYMNCDQKVIKNQSGLPICLNLFKHHTHLKIRNNFFTERVMNEWNNLTLAVKKAEDTTTFKIYYDKYYQDG